MARQLPTRVPGEENRMARKPKPSPESRAEAPSPRAAVPRLSRKDLHEVLTFAKGLARAGGALAMSFFGRANPLLRFDHDLVTEADVAVQDFLRHEVRAAYPSHQFLGEEGRRRPQDVEPAQPLWVVDPLDGSACFSSGMPVWGLSLALFDGGRPVLGVIHLPVTTELYSAMLGEKAMLNDRPIAVREESWDNESLLLTYSRFHSDFTTRFPGKVRSLGSTAAHMAYVARGAAGAAILGNAHVWDIAAGCVILEAAGGAVRDLTGTRVELTRYLPGERIDIALLAAPRGLHAEIAASLEPR
jgi:myo-inositol-1(or 4)-monophosphatase